MDVSCPLVTANIELNALTAFHGAASRSSSVLMIAHEEIQCSLSISPPGLALVDASEAMKELGEVKDALDMEVKQNFIDPLQNLHDKDLKEIQASYRQASWVLLVSNGNVMDPVGGLPGVH